MRKVIQLVTRHESGGDSFLVALCDDSTIWQLDGIQWNRLESVPGCQEIVIAPTPPPAAILRTA